MKKYLNLFTAVYALGVTLTTLIAFGIVGREVSFLIAGLYMTYIAFSPARQGTQLFIGLIPFFIALPITESFDNFNMWRICLVVLGIRWAFEKNRLVPMVATARSLSSIRTFVTTFRLEAAGMLFLALSAASILVGVDYEGGVTRLIYLVNAAMLFIIVRSLTAEKPELMLHFSRSFLLGAGMAVLFGYVQFMAAYFAPAWIFHYWWGMEVSIAQYGKMWGDIVTNQGNTWFSYSGGTLRLRMFSVFPDSHTFPMYIVMALPALFALLYVKLNGALPFIGSVQVSKKIIAYVMGGIALLFLPLILSGTRGIWLASLCPLALVALLWWTRNGKPYAKAILVLILLFLLLVPVYFAISLFPQFQDSEFSALASLGRIRSLIDFGETSNAGRINIWRTTISYVIQQPVWGIGLANYPLILSENPTASLAGSSAHNLYLHIAAVSGIPALMAALWFVAELVLRGLAWVRKMPTNAESVYQVGVLFALAWIGGYLMTDAALFDERALLGFFVMTGISAGLFVARKAK